MPYALCPMPYIKRAPHVTEKGYSVLNYLKRIPKILAGQKFGNYLG